MPLPLVGIVGTIAAPVVLAIGHYMIPFIIKSSLKLLGVGVLTWAATSALTLAAEDYIFQYLSGVPANVYSILAIAGFIDFLEIMIAGWAASLQAKAIFGEFTKIRPTQGPWAPPTN